MAAAGPAMSFLLGFGTYFAVGGVPIESNWLREVLQYFIVMNIVLGAFNLLPGFPMDGGRIFRSFMMLFLSRPKATFVAMWVGRVVAVLLGLSGLYALLNGGSWAIVRIFIAWMIWKDGYREYQLALMESGWEYHDFRAKVSPPPYEQ